MEITKPDISLIGSGSLGSALIRALHEQGYMICSIYNRTVSKALELAEKTGTAVTGSFPEKVAELGELVVVTVPDDLIGSVALRLANIDDSWNGRLIIHCSGVHTSDVFDCLKEKGAQTAVFHPLQTFRPDSPTSAFTGVMIDIEGDPEACDLLRNLSNVLGARSAIIDREDKILVHLAAVFVCNYQVTLSEIAAKLLEKVSSPDFKDLEPLMRQTLNNIINKGPGDALSGPLSRGDVDTIRKHLSILDEYPEMGDLYKLLGKYSLGHIVKPKAGDERFEQIKRLLGE